MCGLCDIRDGLSREKQLKSHVQEVIQEEYCIIEGNKPNKCLARYCAGSLSVSVLRANCGVVHGTCDDETSAELTISETGQHANSLLGPAILGDKRGVAVGGRTQCSPQCYRPIDPEVLLVVPCSATCCCT